MNEEVKQAKAATARVWSILLDYMLQDRAEDGTLILQLVFEQNPELRERLVQAFERGAR